MIKSLTIERKERIKPHTKGNYPDPKMSYQGDKIRLVLAYHEEDGGTLVEFPLIVKIDDARGVDVGDVITMHIELAPVGHAQDVPLVETEQTANEVAS